MKIAKKVDGKIQLIKGEEFIYELDFKVEDLKPVIEAGLNAECFGRDGQAMPDHATRLKYLEYLSKIARLLKIAVKDLPAQDDPELVRAMNELSRLSAERQAELLKVRDGHAN